VKEGIIEALQRNFLLVLDRLTAEATDNVVNSMWRERVAVGEAIIDQGTLGDYFFVVEDGTFEVTLDGAKVNEVQRWGSFGELSLLYNCPRTASIECIMGGGGDAGRGEMATLWLLDRDMFNKSLGGGGNRNDLNEIVRTFRRVELFEPLSDAQLLALADSALPVQFSPGERVIREGERGSIFYIIKSGSVLCIGADSVGADSSEQKPFINTLTAGDYFGERALLLGEPRSADVMAETSVTAFALDREAFDELRHMLRFVPYHSLTADSLNNVQLLRMLNEHDRSNMLQHAEVRDYATGDYIVRQGELGAEFYIVKSGTVAVTKTVNEETGHTVDSAELLAKDKKPRDGDADVDGGNGDVAVEHFVSELRVGDYFGEMALLKQVASAAGGTAPTDADGAANSAPGAALRAANCVATGVEGEGATCYVISAAVFHDLMGSGKMASAGAVIRQQSRGRSLDLAKAHMMPEMHEQQQLSEASVSSYSGGISSPMGSRELAVGGRTLRLQDLEVVGVLGEGAFGEVKLVQHTKETQRRYALKMMEKKTIVAQRQQMNVLNEKAALKQADHPFVLRLMGTMKDAAYLYLLLELVVGQELFYYLRLKKRLPHTSARFYAACVVLALEHLHGKNILYRDLKPENLMVDETGYIKCVDFGFAKVVLGHTHTMCGTPEYMSPELVLGEGHGKGVDYWALGVLVHEMVVGATPFAGKRDKNGEQDQMGIIRSILRYAESKEQGGRREQDNWKGHEWLLSGSQSLRSRKQASYFEYPASIRQQPDHEACAKVCGQGSG
jgi:cGMP-dependent protein kinase